MLGLKILLTGATGFLGSALTHRLKAVGFDIALLLRPSSNTRRLCGIDQDCKMIRYVADDELAEFLNQVQPDIVIHNACSYGGGDNALIDMIDANVRLGLQIMQIIVKSERHLTFINTGTALDSEVSAYALTKNQFSQWGRHISQESDGRLKFINVRLQHMYGPGDDLNKFTSHVINACYRRNPYLNLTAGESKRDFVYIDDVVNAYLIILKNHNDMDSYIDVDVGSGIADTIRQFVMTVHNLTKSTTRLCFGAIPYRRNEPMYCKADLSVMTSLGWRPNYTIESGLLKTIELEFKK
jgi:CDP-paratose synthetase